ncbi:MAG: hypothetical protein E6H08_19915 [Bacteroidetes bacterium]|nr:MAG: hypothetical protein E6H08_19915 [Bacteroidota bacterium]
MNVNELHVMVFSPEPIQIGTKLTRTNKQLTIPVGIELLGKLINPFGVPLSVSEAAITTMDERLIDTPPPGVDTRARIKKPFTTGSTLVDMMVPLGKGQKELIIGDRKTGKSSFLLTTIANQIAQGTIAIYAAIGKKKSDIKHLEEIMTKYGLQEKFIIVATSSDDSPGLIYVTPFTAMTIAEYFRDIGQDVVVVLDDLTTHAKFYREISLVAKNFPGRDSYPGDIFYTHARLLERAGNFKHKTEGEVAITCLPIVEIVEGDLTGYIATTLMGITDGHIFFDSDIFFKGRRPAVNIGLSVTRVGRQTQTQVKRDITRELTSFLTLYEKMQTLSHFGTELTENVKNILATGNSIYDFFDEQYTLVVPEKVQLILFCLIWLKLLEGTKIEIENIKIRLISALQKKETQALFDEVLQANSFNDLLRNVSVNKEKIFAVWKK